MPFVPVPGNHDWFDGGDSWKAHYGPDNYSFDIDRVHFVVWNLAMRDDAVRVFLGEELSRVDKAMTIVVLTHAPPDRAVIEVLREQGVSYLLTGHTHTNRSFDHGGLIELNTEPFVMGGLDFTPAGYRVVTIENGQLTSSHHTVIDEPSVSVVAPRPDGCAGNTLIVASELDASTSTVTARIDGGDPLAMAHVGGWSWSASLPALDLGVHALAIEARSAAGRSATHTTTFQTCRADPGPEVGADWPQVGGGADHVGARACELGPPLAVQWTQTIGGHALQAAPVVAAGVVYVTITDLGDGNGGGVVAIDLATGAIRWRVGTTMPVRGSPAVVGSTVVIARVDGRVIGLDVATGTERWRAELGAGQVPQAAAIFASVVTDGGDVLVGNQRAFGPLSGSSGAAQWLVDPVLAGRDSQSFSAAAVSNGTVIGVFNRRLGGVIAWDRTTGEERWRVDTSYTVAINATPIIAEGTVYVVNGRDEVVALDLITGALKWMQVLDPTGFDWGNATVGAPAYAHGVLVVPTLYRDVVALDTLTGSELWRFAGTPSPLHTTHYRGAKEAGFEAAPVITGEIVWVVDTSGILTALDLATGKAIWQTAVGVPVLAGAAVSGEWLVLASFDGTVRAFAPASPHVIPASCAVASSGGCCDAGGARSSTTLSLVVAALIRRRRSRPTRPPVDRGSHSRT